MRFPYYSLKERSKTFREERIAALLKSWSDLEQTDVAQVSKADCLAWATRFGKTASPSAFNNPVGTLKLVLDTSFPIYQIADGQFLVDATGGQVAGSPELAGRRAAATTVTDALEQDASLVVNLITRIQTSAADQQTQATMQGLFNPKV